MVCLLEIALISAVIIAVAYFIYTEDRRTIELPLNYFGDQRDNAVLGNRGEPHVKSRSYFQLQIERGLTYLDCNQPEAAAQHFANALAVNPVVSTALPQLGAMIPRSVYKMVLYKLLRGLPKYQRVATQILRQHGWPLNPDLNQPQPQ